MYRHSPLFFGELPMLAKGSILTLFEIFGNVRYVTHVVVWSARARTEHFQTEPRHLTRPLFRRNRIKKSGIAGSLQISGIGQGISRISGAHKCFCSGCRGQPCYKYLKTVFSNQRDNRSWAPPLLFIAITGILDAVNG